MHLALTASLATVAQGQNGWNIMDVAEFVEPILVL